MVIAKVQAPPDAGRQAGGPIYSVTQIEGNLTSRRPWVGRTVLVRGLLAVSGCPYRVPNGNVGHTFYYRYECYLIPDWVVGKMRSHRTFMMPAPFVLAARAPASVANVIHDWPLVGRLAPFSVVKGTMDTEPHVYRLLLAPPRDCHNVAGLPPCPLAQLEGRVS